MKRKFRTLLACLCIPTFLAVSSPASAEEHPMQPNKVSFEDRFVGDGGGPSVVAKASLAGGLVTAHNAHLGKHDGKASGHVSWTRVGLPKYTQMKLTAQLYAWSTFKYWPAGAANTKTTGPSQGNKQTPGANARVTCKTNARTYWYTYGIGTIPGAQKPTGYHSSASSVFNCYPW